MKKYVPMKAWLILLWLCFTLAQASAQTEIITFPVNGTVFQKNSAGNYNCHLAGQLQNTNAMYYRIQKKNGTSWNDIATDIQLSSTWAVGDRRGFYKAHGNLSTGWYRVRLYRKYKVWLFFNKRVYKDTKEFGVGDVYFIGGQSNAAGYSEEDPLSSGIGGDNTNPFYPVNISNEVRVIHDKNENSYSSELKNGIPYKSKFDPLVSGTHFLNDKKGFYPNGAASWCWPALGKMISDGGTPVMFFNNAWPGSSVNSDWNDNATLKGKFTRTLTQYGNILGAKGVLWHQGERDAQILTLSSTNSGGNRNTYLNTYKNGMTI